MKLSDARRLREEMKHLKDIPIDLGMGEGGSTIEVPWPSQEA